MKLLELFRRRKNYNEADILNAGLDMAMEFGKNWLQPIQERLGKKFPALKNSRLDHYNKICRGAMKAGQKFIYDTLAANQEPGHKIDSKDLQVDFEQWMVARYPWVDQANLRRVFSQGMYYAWHDGYNSAD
ncbi:MAG: hypothetical protein EOP51_00300 [Sphingobacteriales bacterium]|nr:MAG: hypothetical protein EOP51_00300 [Sphingobacteriales bacterium]